MKHVIFVTLLALYVVLIGQNWSHYSAALMAAAYFRQGGDLKSRLW